MTWLPLAAITCLAVGLGVLLLTAVVGPDPVRARTMSNLR